LTLTRKVHKNRILKQLQTPDFSLVTRFSPSFHFPFSTGKLEPLKTGVPPEIMESIVMSSVFISSKVAGLRLRVKLGGRCYDKGIE